LLGPFGLETKKITLESRSNQLSDVALVIMLKGDIRLFLTYSGFELFISNLKDSQVSLVPKVADSVCSLLEDLGVSLIGASLDIRYRAHLELGEGVPSTVLQFHMPRPPENRLEADGFTYRLHPDPSSVLKQGRISVARSILLKEGLFVEAELTYGSNGASSELANSALHTVRALLYFVGLEQEVGNVPGARAD
jgi:hypothetical protein